MGNAEMHYGIAYQPGRKQGASVSPEVVVNLNPWKMLLRLPALRHPDELKRQPMLFLVLVFNPGYHFSTLLLVA